MLFPTTLPQINPVNKSYPLESDKKHYNINYNLNGIGLMYQTPIKHQINFKGNNGTSFQFDLNFYYVNNVWSTGYNPEIIYQQENGNMNAFFFKNSLEKSGYKITPPTTEQKKDFFEFNINNSNNDYNNSNKSFNNVKINNVYSCDSNNDESAKKNLNELFNNIRLQNFYNINYDDTNNSDNRKSLLKIESIKNDIIFNSSPNNNCKKLFECSGSTLVANPSKSFTKKKRFRKNGNQINILSKFFYEHKNWSRKEIKEISKRSGLDENKVYKWLWDQKTKKFKTSTMFVVNKNEIKLDENNEDNEENNCDEIVG